VEGELKLELSRKLENKPVWSIAGEWCYRRNHTPHHKKLKEQGVHLQQPLTRTSLERAYLSCRNLAKVSKGPIDNQLPLPELR
jgi:hypothetical protein